MRNFVARQKRMRFEDEDFYVDLVLYNYLLRCQIFAAKDVEILPTERVLTSEIERERRLVDARHAGRERSRIS